MRADEAHRGERFVQLRVGLHHVCFRARERSDVDALNRSRARLSGGREGPAFSVLPLQGEPTPGPHLACLGLAVVGDDELEFGHQSHCFIDAFEQLDDRRKPDSRPLRTGDVLPA